MMVEFEIKKRSQRLIPFTFIIDYHEAKRFNLLKRKATSFEIAFLHTKKHTITLLFYPKITSTLWVFPSAKFGIVQPAITLPSTINVFTPFDTLDGFVTSIW